MTTPESNDRHLFRVISLAGFLTAMMVLPTTSLAMDINNGRKLYTAHCVSCHGLDGHSTMPQAPHLFRGENLAKSDFELVNTLKTGTPKHPPFFGVIVEKEMFDLVGYIRTLVR